MPRSGLSGEFQQQFGDCRVSFDEVPVVSYEAKELSDFFEVPEQ
jgi:hypothetical protein